MNQFSELGLAETLLRATAASGYETATPIQAAAIPEILAGADLIGCAQTGTGKTAAFTLPMLDLLSRSAPPRREAPGNRRGNRKASQSASRFIRALVLSPTRELAAQIGESLHRYGRFTGLRHTVIYGGISQHQQVKALVAGVDSLVATPGRLLDLIDQGYVDLSAVEILVLDEADQMLDMGFLPALKRIVALVPEQRQTLMFSATMPTEIRRLANRWLNDPAQIEVAPVATPAERIEQSVHFLDKTDKPAMLASYLHDTKRSRTLVFSRTKHGADKIVRHLTKQGIRAAAIHGNKSQNARLRVLAQFKGNNPPVLVATDIAARGLDVNDISHVVNYDLPETPETYVHRIGRTARAGAEGVAVSFCSRDERGLLKQIEQLTRHELEVASVAEGFGSTRPSKSHDSSPRGRRSGGRRFGQPTRAQAGRGNGAASGGGRPSRKPRGTRSVANARPR